MDQLQPALETSYGADYRLINELLAGLRVERELRLCPNVNFPNPEHLERPIPKRIAVSADQTNQHDGYDIQLGEISVVRSDEILREMSDSDVTSISDCLKQKWDETHTNDFTESQNQSTPKKNIQPELNEEDCIVALNERGERDLGDKKPTLPRRSCARRSKQSVLDRSPEEEGEQVVHTRGQRLSHRVVVTATEDIASRMTVATTDSSTTEHSAASSVCGYKRPRLTDYISEFKSPELPCKRQLASSLVDDDQRPLAFAHVTSCGTKRLNPEIFAPELGSGSFEEHIGRAVSSPCKRRALPIAADGTSNDGEPELDPPSPAGGSGAAA